jgi:hypothetical protein
LICLCVCVFRGMKTDTMYLMFISLFFSRLVRSTFFSLIIYLLI